ncbi:MAG: DUF2846 domain-containing protein [Paracoccus sp. (in: a-proteobacteria)]
MKKIALLFAALSLSACASGTSLQETGAAKQPIAADKGRIVVYRTSLMGMAVQPDVYIDGAKASTCAPRGAFSKDVAPGTHSISATTETQKTVQIAVQPGQTADVRCSIGFGMLVGRAVFEAVPAATGQKESAGLAFTGKY